MPSDNGSDPVDRFVPCSWACETCVEHGTAKPWRAPGETAEATAGRFSIDTRGRCVEGCTFTAEPAAGANNGGR